MILNWQKLKGTERDSAWEALEEWVWWLRSTYPEAREAVVDCWPRHPNMVNELTALYVWWEEIYEPMADEVPDPDRDEPPKSVSGEPMGRSAVSWHADLQHAVQRWRSNSKCTSAECVLDRQMTEDVVADWRKRRARTRAIVTLAQQSRDAVLGEAGARVPALEP